MLYLLACFTSDPADPAAVTRWTLDNGARIVVHTAPNREELVGAWSEDRMSFASPAEEAATVLALFQDIEDRPTPHPLLLPTAYGATPIIPGGTSLDMEAGEAFLLCRRDAWELMTCLDELTRTFRDPDVSRPRRVSGEDNPAMAALMQLAAYQSGERIGPADMDAVQPAWTLADARARVRAVYDNPGRYVFVFTGPIPASVLAPAIEATLGALPGTPVDPVRTPVALQPPPPSALVPAGAKGQLIQAWTAACDASAGDRVALLAVRAAVEAGLADAGTVQAQRKGEVCAIEVVSAPDRQDAVAAAVAAAPTVSLSALRATLRAPIEGSTSLVTLQRLHDVELEGAILDPVAEDAAIEALDVAQLTAARDRFLDPARHAQAFLPQR